MALRRPCANTGSVELVFPPVSLWYIRYNVLKDPRVQGIGGNEHRQGASLGLLQVRTIFVLNLLLVGRVELHIVSSVQNL